MARITKIAQDVAQDVAQEVAQDVAQEVAQDVAQGEIGKRSFPAAGREALKNYRETREAAVKRLREVLEKSSDTNLVLGEALKADLALVLGKCKNKKPSSKQKTKELFDLLSNKKRILLSEAARALGVQEAKVLSLNKALRKISRGEERVFAGFELGTNELVLDHVGPTAPKGWKEVR